MIRLLRRIVWRFSTPASQWNTVPVELMFRSEYLQWKEHEIEDLRRKLKESGERSRERFDEWHRLQGEVIELRRTCERLRKSTSAGRVKRLEEKNRAAGRMISWLLKQRSLREGELTPDRVAAMLPDGYEIVRKVTPHDGNEPAF